MKLNEGSKTSSYEQRTYTVFSGEILVLALAKPDAIAAWRALLGPTNASKAKEDPPHCMRAKYGHDHTRNGLHGSDSVFNAEREIKFMFPDSGKNQVTYKHVEDG